MRKVITGGIAVTLGVSTALAAGAFAGGNGAQMSGLSPTSDNGPTNCQENDGTNTNGWTILNAPGQPTAVKFLNGEVHLIGAAPSTTYQIDIANDGSSSCMPTMDTVKTNANGIGNGHIDIPTGTAGSYYIALFDSTNMNEQYASGPLTVK